MLLEQYLQYTEQCIKWTYFVFICTMITR